MKMTSPRRRLRIGGTEANPGVCERAGRSHDQLGEKRRPCAPRLLATLIALLCVGAIPSYAGEMVVAYVPNWVDLNSFAKGIDYSKLTHINIAFENPTNEVGDLSFHEKNKVLIAAAHDKNVKVLVSIGGGGAASNKRLQARYFDLISDTKRGDFVKRLAAYVVDHGFDGLDVDIEGPSINKDYGALIRDLSAELKPRKKLLTAALSQGYGGKNVPDSVFEHFDFINVMAYDGAGSWNPNAPGQHSSLEFTKRSVDYWLKRGLPPAKTVVGVPFYGYGFGKAFRRGSYSYKELVSKYPDAPRMDQVGETIWYNGMATIEAKTNYVIDQGLAGIMIWSLDHDVKGDQSLLGVITKTIQARKGVSSRGPG